jgi:hypothetical protein
MQAPVFFGFLGSRPTFWAKSGFLGNAFENVAERLAVRPDVRQNQSQIKSEI